jgi:hypothetical protein
MPKPVDQFKPGQRVTVTQQIAQRDEVWTTSVTGKVIRFEQNKTGSWFAHSKDDKLWLDRLVLEKSDGEIIVLNLDQYSRIEALDDPAGVAAQGANPSEAAPAKNPEAAQASE